MKRSIALSIALFFFTLAGHAATVSKFFGGHWRVTLNRKTPNYKVSGQLLVALSDDGSAAILQSINLTNLVEFRGTWEFTGPGRISLNVTNPINGNRFWMSNSSYLDNQIEGKFVFGTGSGLWSATRQSIPAP